MKINQRLFDHYGIDTSKDLQIRGRCPRPFDTVLIDKQGSCYACECQSWLPQSIGNLNVMPLTEILRSTTAERLQGSITDGSYRYCNSAQCSYILDRRYVGVPWNTDTPERRIRHIRLAIDNSCNLSCPSCRTGQIFERDKSRLAKRFNMADKIIEFIRQQSHTVNVHVGSDGDPFASLVYRYFIRHTKSLVNVRYTVQTNGLLVKKMYQKHKDMFGKLNTLNISIDGASEQTYNRLRRGGSFSKLLENLEAIKRLKSDHGFELVMHFVVQNDNYHELEAMSELAESFDADRMWFNRITDWNTFADFKEVDVMDPRHRNHDECISAIQRVRDREWKVLIEMPTLLT